MLGRPSIVVCAGMPRSASTWLYNTLRYLLGAGGEPAYGAWIDDYDADHPSVVHVVKVHRFTPDLAATGDVVLTTRRDLRDIAASLSRRNWATADNLMVKLGKMVSDHQHCLPYSAYEVAYERMMPAKALEIARLADVLGCGRIRRLPAPSTGWWKASTIEVMACTTSATCSIAGTSRTVGPATTEKSSPPILWSGSMRNSALGAHATATLWMRWRSPPPRLGDGKSVEGRRLKQHVLDRERAW